ncbi:hypothetical protein [Nakamurella endophytica]|uniref:hypothetical protein n=1 Tax=Nakamurella endophytica TaxID=1748367 RepID=UPI00166B7CA1|nr:hypothetical protein [Nakamurella endophytica]
MSFSAKASKPVFVDEGGSPAPLILYLVGAAVFVAIAIGIYQAPLLAPWTVPAAILGGTLIILGGLMSIKAAVAELLGRR